MANNYGIENQVSSIIYEQVRYGEFNIDSFNKYIELILVDKFNRSKDRFLKDNILNLMCSLIYRENDAPKEFVTDLKDKLSSYNITEYIENIKLYDDNQLYDLLDNKRSNETNKQLAYYYGTSHTLDIYLAIDLLFNHLNDEDFNLDETSMKVILESICYDKLDSLGIDGHICFFCDKNSISSTLLGEYNDGTETVLMNDIHLDKLVNFDYDNIDEHTFSSIETVFHECEHANQFIGSKKLSFTNIIIEKDLLLKNHGPEFYYDANYREISFEILARKKQVIDTFRLLAENNPVLSDKYFELMSKSIENENELLSETIKPNHKFNDGESNYGLIDEFIHGVLSKDTTLIESYPLLKYEYNNDGTKKSILDIFNSISLLERNSEFYEYTFSLFKSINTTNDIELLNNLNDISRIETDDEIIIMQICFNLLEVINHYSYLSENINNDKMTYIIDCYKNDLMELYKFCNYNNKWSVKLKTTIDKELDKLNNRGISK